MIFVTCNVYFLLYFVVNSFFAYQIPFVVHFKHIVFVQEIVFVSGLLIPKIKKHQTVVTRCKYKTHNYASK